MVDENPYSINDACLAVSAGSPKINRLSRHLSPITPVGFPFCEWPRGGAQMGGNVMKLSGALPPRHSGVAKRSGLELLRSPTAGYSVSIVSTAGPRARLALLAFHDTFWLLERQLIVWLAAEKNTKAAPQWP